MATKKKDAYTLSLAAGMGAVAGLRPMVAPAIIAYARKKRWIHLGNSLFATTLSGRASRRINELLVSEFIADKLPFTSSRLNAGPLASRIASGALCGAAVCTALKQPPTHGALLGGLAALASALATHHLRNNLGRRIPDFAAGLLEDALAVSGGALITALTVVRK